MTMMASLTPDDYTIAWICALPLEAAAARAMLDKIHTPPRQSTTDPNAYEFGELSGHYIVIAHLPDGVYGKVSAAAVVSRMRSTFRRLEFGVMVGIGGGVPGGKNDIRLGDIVVSTPGQNHSGVIQYDYGKAVQGGEFKQTGTLNKPPQILLRHMSQLEAKQMNEGEGSISRIVREVLERNPNMKERFSPPEQHTDLLFRSFYHHANEEDNCKQCDKEQLVKRRPRSTMTPSIHYGLIASGDKVMKDSETRDRLAQQHDPRILCFEMEAAGLMDELPTLVIRGICDYCDSHKQKDWQGYAALTAAAYTKLLLSDVPKTPALSNYGYSSEDRRCLQDLLLSNPDDDRRRIEATKGGLLNDSFQWILDTAEYQGWFNNPGSQLLWIKGDAGKGKTMLMIGIINELLKPESSKLPSYFLCQGTDSNLNNATAVLRGLIYMLISQHPSLISHLRKRYDIEGQRLFDGANAFYGLSSVFENMIEDLKQSTVHLLVDALDECQVDLEELLRLMAKTLSMRSVKVKWIVSSRNMNHIEQILDLDHRANKLSLELNTNRISHAIKIYINYKVSHLRILKDDEGLQAQVKDLLHQKSGGTFLYVALVVQELQGCRLQKDILNILEATPAGLPDLYDRMIWHIQQQHQHHDVCLTILSMVVLAYRPMHLLEACHLAGMHKVHDMESAVGMCGSFLTIRDGYIYLIHQSAKDHLDKFSSTTAIFPHRSKVHYQMFRQSLQALSATLRRNIYGLTDPAVLTSGIATLRPDPDPLFALRYSCTFWLDHFLEVESEFTDGTETTENGVIPAFFRKHLLHWLESLSLIGEVRHGILILRRLVCQQQPVNGINELSATSDGFKRSIWRRLRQKVHSKYTVSDQQSGHKQHHSVFKEAERFASTNSIIIQEAPLQTYGAALVFCPQKSMSKTLYWDERLEFIERAYITQESWDPCTHVLKGHRIRVDTVVFSPDGQAIASSSYDGTIRLWDTVTGTVRQTVQGYREWFIAVAFSPDWQTVAHAFNDGAILLWDRATGTERQMLQGHTGQVNAVVFSPNGQIVASASDDRTIRLWDTATGTMRQILQGHIYSVKAVVFSPDGQTVASVSDDKTIRLIPCASDDWTIRLWDTATGTARQTLQGHTGRVSAVAFSPDGQTVASASADRTVRLWDIATGTVRRTLQGHTGWVNAVAFSPNRQIVASASNDWTVRLWDATTGTVRQILQGHTGWVNAVAFSPDGQTVASASDDWTIRLWDTAIGTARQIQQGHTGQVNAVAFSPNRQIVASASDDKTIRLWDTATGTARQTLQGHTDWVETVAFSPDGQTVASASADRTIRLWDTATGTVRRTLQGHRYSVKAVAFSLDGQTVASASHDKTIRLWDTATGTARQTLQGYTGQVNAVAFSLDGQTVAFASDDKTIRLWDIATGTERQTLQGHTSVVDTVAFSPDGQTVISSSGRTIRLWDIATGTVRRTLQGHDRSYWSFQAVACSPDGQTVASASADETIRLWDTATGAQKQIHHLDVIPTALSFSADGCCLNSDRGSLFVEHKACDSFRNKFFVHDEWISRNGQRLIWLPPEYRPTCVLTRENTVILGHISGPLTFLWLN